MVFVGSLMTLGCGVEDGVLATVGEAKVDLATFQEHLEAATGEPWEGVTDPVASRLLDQFLDQEIVLVAANRGDHADVPSEPGIRSARVRLLLDGLCGPPPPPDPELVEVEVASALSVDLPARAHVRQMLLNSLEEAEDARRQLDEGADFVELSRNVSRAPNAEGGGDLGLLTQGGLSADLDDVIFALQAGEISEPVSGPSGYHIFQVLEVVPAGPPPRSEIEPGVRRRLGEVSAREHSAECVRRLAGEVGVRVILDQLWFHYQGRYSEVIDEE
jgi:parvulin-like peptidyl-prolyl isomerase